MQATPERTEHATSAAPRTTPLSPDELFRFYEDGFLRLGGVVDDSMVDDLRRSIATGRADDRLESDLLDDAAWPDGEGGVPQEPGRNVSFLFNMWREDDTFRHLVTNPVLARIAAQALGATSVRVLEDNALTKDPHSGGELKWHQDYAYWPLGQPNAVTVWIALDRVTLDNGAMRMARREPPPRRTPPGGLRHWCRVLPRAATSGRGADHRPRRRRPQRRHHRAGARRGLAAPCIDLARVRRQRHRAPTAPAVVRFVADGTTWFGARRYEFNYTDAELGLTPGDPIGGDYFPVVPTAPPT